MLQFKSDLAKCKCRTNKQVLDLIKRNGYKVVKDTSEDVGTFSVWIDELTRIYKNNRKEYIYYRLGRRQICHIVAYPLLTQVGS